MSNNKLEALAVPGGRGRAACQRVAEFSNDLAVALRRSVPFLSRRRVPITAEPARCQSFAELAADDSIVHATAFTMKQKPSDGGTHGLVLLDETALARILDGVLGGDGSPSPAAPKRPTAAQGALASRISSSLLRAFGEVLANKLELTIEAHPSKDIESGGAVVVALSIDGGGRILIALPLTGIRTDEPIPNETVDTRLVNALQDVELDVVAELGKVRLPLDTIVQLQVGDVLRLSLPLDERARVCAGGAVIFHGRPTASGDSVGVALERSAG
jgi:flagellar motor switch protein FliM